MIKVNPKPNSQSGFTLLETLIAFMVLSLVLTVIFQVLGTGSRSARMTSDYVDAVILAQSLLAVSSQDQNRQQSGQTAAFQWQVLMKPAELQDLGYDPKSSSQLQLIDIEAIVSWDRHGKKRQITLSKTILSDE